MSKSNLKPCKRVLDIDYDFRGIRISDINGKYVPVCLGDIEFGYLISITIYNTGTSDVLHIRPTAEIKVHNERMNEYEERQLDYKELFPIAKIDKNRHTMTIEKFIFK